LAEAVECQCRVGLIGADRWLGGLGCRRKDGNLRRVGCGVRMRSVGHVPRLVRIAPTKPRVIGPCGNMRSYPALTSI